MRVVTAVLALAAMLTAACGSAGAAVSVAGGGYVATAPSAAGGAAILSSGASIPTVPLEVQGSLLVPFAQGGGYAATAEIRGFTGGGYGGAYVGAGAGIGDISAGHSSAAVFTIFAGKAIAPLTSVEFRFYKEASGGTAGFAGVRFSF